jgi:hypothetical protein
VALRGIHGLGGQAVKLSQEVRQYASDIRHDEVVMVGHHAGCMHNDTRPLRREGEAVKENAVCL